MYSKGIKNALSIEKSRFAKGVQKYKDINSFARNGSEMGKSDADGTVFQYDDEVCSHNIMNCELGEVVQVDPLALPQKVVQSISGKHPKTTTLQRKFGTVVVKPFGTATNFNDTSVAELVTNQPPPKVAKTCVNSFSDSTDILSQILESQKIMIANQEKIDERLKNLEKACENNAFDRATLLAQNQSLRECKVLISKVLRSVGRMTGELEDELQIEIAATLPLGSIDAAKEVEEKLENQEYFAAMKIYLHQIKGSNGTINDVLRRLMTDELLFLFNFDGRKEKRALTKLKLVNQVLYEVFTTEGRQQFEKALKKCIELSHNRFHQKKYSLTKK